MKAWIRGLSARGEFAVVIAAAFGLALAGTVLVLAKPEQWLGGAPPITDVSLLKTVAFELVVGPLLWQILVLRGWTAARIGLSPVPLRSRELVVTLLTALGLALGAYAGYAVLAIVALNIWPQMVWSALSHRLVAPHLSAVAVLMVVLVNPLFEEVFVCGYVVSALRDRFGVATAVNTSAAIRVAYHLYQGMTGVLGITPFALIAASWFARTQRLLPLVLAHAFIDFMGLWVASAYAR